MEWIYGRQVVRMALGSGACRPPKRIAGTVQAFRALGMDARRLSIPVETLHQQALDDLTGSREHQGIAALVDRYPYAEADELYGQGLIVALDEVADPRNLGAVARSALASGASGLVITRRNAAAVTPAAVKASAGATEHLPIAQVTNMRSFLMAAQKAGGWAYGAAGDAPESYLDVPYDGPIVLVLGAEGSGLRRLVADTCDRLVSIPMHGAVESLNVSVAAALLLYEARRQRAAASSATAPGAAAASLTAAGSGAGPRIRRQPAHRYESTAAHESRRGEALAREPSGERAGRRRDQKPSGEWRSPRREPRMEGDWREAGRPSFRQGPAQVARGRGQGAGRAFDRERSAPDDRESPAPYNRQQGRPPGHERSRPYERAGSHGRDRREHSGSDSTWSRGPVQRRPGSPADGRAGYAPSERRSGHTAERAGRFGESSRPGRGGSNERTRRGGGPGFGTGQAGGRDEERTGFGRGRRPQTRERRDDRGGSGGERRPPARERDADRGAGKPQRRRGPQAPGDEGRFGDSGRGPRPDRGSGNRRPVGGDMGGKRQRPGRPRSGPPRGTRT